jgi:hypothetical protein
MALFYAFLKIPREARDPYQNEDPIEIGTGARKKVSIA